jgi:hypothetical protein
LVAAGAPNGEDIVRAAAGAVTVYGAVVAVLFALSVALMAAVPCGAVLGTVNAAMTAPPGVAVAVVVTTVAPSVKVIVTVAPEPKPLPVTVTGVVTPATLDDGLAARVGATTVNLPVAN